DRSPFNSAQHNTFINKAINAKQHGARGIIFITDFNHEDEEVGRTTRGTDTDDLGIPAVHAKRAPLLKPLADVSKGLAAIQRKIDTDLRPQSFELPARVHIATEIVRSRKTVKNVVAAITGSDILDRLSRSNDFGSNVYA